MTLVSGNVRYIEKDFLNSYVLSWRRKVYSDWEDVTFSDRVFQVFGMCWRAGLFLKTIRKESE